MTSNVQEFWNFVGSWFPDSDLEGVFEDEHVVRNFINTKNTPKIEAVRLGLREVIESAPVPFQRVSEESNRNFESEADCRNWLRGVLTLLEENSTK